MKIIFQFKLHFLVQISIHSSPKILSPFTKKFEILKKSEKNDYLTHITH